MRRRRVEHIGGGSAVSLGASPPSSYECSTLGPLGRKILHLLILIMSRWREDAHGVSEKRIGNGSTLA